MFLLSFSRWNDNLSYTTISVTKLDYITHPIIVMTDQPIKKLMKKLEVAGQLAQ